MGLIDEAGQERDAAFYRSLAAALSQYERNKPAPSDKDDPFYDVGLAIVSIVTPLSDMCLHHLAGLRALAEALRDLQAEEDRQTAGHADNG